jgi:hypothetical protein
MEELIERLKTLYKKVEDSLKQLNGMDERDAGRAYFTVLRNEVAGCIMELKVNAAFATKHTAEFEQVLGNREFVGNYLSTFIQHVNETVVGTFIFQTELLFRTYKSTLNGTSPADQNMHQIFALLFDDVQGSWQKEESNLFVLIWAIRNTIHTAGIYFGRENGRILRYNEIDFRLENGRPPDLSPVQDWYGLLLPLVDAVLALYLYNSTSTTSPCTGSSNASAAKR